MTPVDNETLFAPVKLGSLELRNRFVRAGAFEGMCPGGLPSDELVRYHESVARGGVGMTTVAYASVSSDGLTYAHQIALDKPEVLPRLRAITDAVHREGAAAAIQIGHAGYFADRSVTGCRPMGASRVLNTYGLSVPRPMDEGDLASMVERFAKCSRLAAEAGFDAIELQACHGYLLSQFLSPYTNRRTDRWGGSLENRLRLTRDVMQAMRKAVGSRLAIVVKMNLRDGFSGGLELDEATEVARALEQEGADALVLSGGFVSKVPMYVMRGDVPFREMYQGQTRLVKKVGLLLLGRVLVKAFPFREAYFLEDARIVRKAVRMPLMLVGGLRRRSHMAEVVAEGFDLLALARPLIMEPDLVNRMRKGETEASTCEPCNKCIGEMDHGSMRCALLDERRGH
jgi:2,4-dienoyl-CoA reductase-like NADH-dependent reductase (Old Yellow Enzyme family)